MIALALLWQTVRHELEWWGYARYTALNPLELETESVVEELWTVNGDGRESISIELAPGLWTIELINPPAATDRTTVNLDGRQWGIGWTSDNPVIVHVGPGYEDADLGIPAGPMAAQRRYRRSLDGPARAGAVPMKHWPALVVLALAAAVAGMLILRYLRQVPIGMAACSSDSRLLRALPSSERRPAYAR